ncbi:MAG: carbohydrate ABC transporter permease [Turicibacter sp.]|nr:carbohydrate ABC transporter permease [Turicibacter sp.]
MAKKKMGTALYHVLILAFGLVMVYPVLWMVSGGFKDNAEILTGSLNLIPSTWRFENFANGWRGFGGIGFEVFFANTFFVATVSTIGTVLSSACIAYALSRVNFKGKKLWFGVMLATMMLPFQVILIPQYIIFHRMGWVNTFAPILVPSFLGRAFFIYLMMQFMVSIPKELDEAAIMDGCNKYTIFTRIIMPLLKPAVITSAIIQFYWAWDDFMGPLIYLQRPRNFTLSIALRQFADSSSVTDWGAMFAMSTLSLLPVFIMFLIFNKQLVEGISTTGIKG